MAAAARTAWPERGLPFLVAEAGGAVAGLRVRQPVAAQARVPAHGRRTRSTWRRGSGAAGLGRLLLEALLTGCADAGVRQVIAVIADSGDPASVALHRACGFADAGRLSRVGYKHGRWIDTRSLAAALRLQPARRGSVTG